MQGDCLERMKEIESGSVDLTVTSPPYDNLRNYNGNNDQWGEHVWKEVLKDLYRVTKDGGVVVWIVGDATIKGSETGTSFKQALHAMACGFNLHDTMIYQKKGAGAVGSNKCYIQNFEYMFIFSKGKIKSTNLICDRENKKQCTTKTNGSRNNNNAETGRKYRTITTKKLGRRFNIWEIEQRNNQDKYHKLHPAPFPENLARDHIISWSNKGDTVFDPFLGSGTTGKMAKNLNRNFIGIELDASYFEIAKERINKTQLVGYVKQK